MGGASVALLNLMTKLKDRVEIGIVFPNSGDFSAQCKSLGFTCFFLPFRKDLYPPQNLRFSVRVRGYISTLLRNKIAYLRLLKLVKGFKPDIIHTNVGPINVGFKAAKRLGIKHVWHIREYMDKDFDMHPIPSMCKYISQYKDKRNYCITITNGIFSHFGLNEVNAQRIYDGVVSDLDTKCQEKENYLLFVGRLQDAKGTKFLLRSFVEYAKTHSKFNLLLAGNGDISYIEECKGLIANAGMDNRVEFLGFRNDVYALMSKAAALIVPSRFEGFGFITVEAMYNHCPVIGYDTGGTHEQFENGILLTGTNIGIPFSNSAELVTEIIKLENTNYDQMIEAAYNTVVALYKIKDHANKIYNIYKSLIQQ